MRLFLIFINLISILIFTGGCKSGQKSVYLQKLDFYSEGWINEQTYQVSTTGNAAKTYGYLNTKEKACANALLAAKVKLYENLLGRTKPSSPPPEKMDAAFFSAVENGLVLSEEFQKDFSCRIAYRIEHENLKSLVDSLHK